MQHRSECALEPVLCPNAGCGARMARGFLADHALECDLQPTKCTVPGCAVCCTRAELAASPLGASHGAHVVTLETQLARAQQQLSDSEQRFKTLKAEAARDKASLTAELKRTQAALRLVPKGYVFRAAKKYEEDPSIVIAILRANQGDMDVHLAACELLHDEDVLMRYTMSDSARAELISLMLSAIRSLWHHDEIRVPTLKVLCTLTKDIHRKDVGTAIVDAAIKALQDQSQPEANVCKFGCLLLSQLTYRNSKRATHAGVNAAVPLVVRML